MQFKSFYFAIYDLEVIFSGIFTLRCIPMNNFLVMMMKNGVMSINFIMASTYIIFIVIIKIITDNCLKEKD